MLCYVTIIRVLKLLILVRIIVSSFSTVLVRWLEGHPVCENIIFHQSHRFTFRRPDLTVMITENKRVVR